MMTTFTDFKVVTEVKDKNCVKVMCKDMFFLSAKKEREREERKKKLPFYQNKLTMQ